MEQMEPVTWKTENWMVEQHRGKLGPWREKGYAKEERESYHGNAKTRRSKMVEEARSMMKHEKQPLRFQKLTKLAKKRARAEERETAEIIPRRCKKHFYDPTKSVLDGDLCPSDCDSDE